MRGKDITERISIEWKILDYVRQALITAVNAPIEERSATIWLERFCFLGESFGRHVKRLFDVEEEGGYMTSVVEHEPNIAPRVESLAQEHDSIYEDLEILLSQARIVRSSNLANLHAVRQQLLGLLQRFERHQMDEETLWSGAYQLDIGGGG